MMPPPLKRIAKIPRSDESIRPKHRSASAFSHHDEHTISNYYAATACCGFPVLGDRRTPMLVLLQFCEVAKRLQEYDNASGTATTVEGNGCRSCGFVKRIEQFLHNKVFAVLNMKSGMCLTMDVSGSEKTCCFSHGQRIGCASHTQASLSEAVSALFSDVVGSSLLQKTDDTGTSFEVLMKAEV